MGEADARLTALTPLLPPYSTGPPPCKLLDIFDLDMTPVAGNPHLVPHQEPSTGGPGAIAPPSEDLPRRATIIGGDPWAPMTHRRFSSFLKIQQADSQVKNPLTEITNPLFATFMLSEEGEGGVAQDGNEANASETADVSVANPVAHIDLRNLVV